MASKGKGVVGKGSPGKRKRGNNDKAGNDSQRRRNREVLQFFEDSAVEFDADSSDDSEFDDIEDFINDIDMEPIVKNEPGKFESVRVFPKEEEMSGDELEKMLHDRYGNGSGYVRYAEDDYDSKKSVDKGLHLRSVAEPTIWKVKCKVGRERHTVFCLMQKYVDMKELGTKLQLISAFVVEHIKGFVFIEAEKQSDVIEACNQLADVYYSIVTRVPINEVSQLFVVRRRYNEVKEGQWARVKSGIYKGDIAQVAAANNERKRATIKLIPRVDLQTLAGKYGGGASVKKSKAVPPARLISARELEEFRPLIQYRRDRDTGKVFEFLDSLMLKDGFLYKKVSFESLSFWDVNPSEDDLQKFAPPNNDASDNLEWLSQLYGEQKKERNVNISKGGGKGEGTSGSNESSSFEVHDLVLFGKRDFGMIIGIEKDETYKILKNGSDGPVINNMGHKDLKYVALDRRFTALDHRTKTVSIGDLVKIIDGPTKGRQGIVKQIYRGVIFLYDENDLDNAYFCSSSLMSEKVKPSDSAFQGKDGGVTSGFEDVPSSPKSPLSPKKPWQMRENNCDDRRNNDEMFSVGQSLRIRVGPLKGYICRVIAIRRSELTVKLDSQQKVLTVKREHLAEVRGKITGAVTSDDTGLSAAFKPFDLLGTDGSNDWLQGSTGSAGGDGWNVGAPSGERSAWPAFPSSGASVGTSATADNDSTKEDDAWLNKVDNKNSSWGAAADNKNSSWGAAAENKNSSWGAAADNKSSSWGAATGEKAVGNSYLAGVSGKSDGDWGKSSGTGATSSWASANIASGNHGGIWKAGGSNVDKEKEGTLGQADAWDKGKKNMETNSWTKHSSQEGQIDSLNKGNGVEDAGGWKVNAACGSAGSSGWGKQKAGKESETWGDAGHSVGLTVGKAGSDAWGEAKESGNLVEDAWSKGARAWGNKSDSDKCSKWKSSATASESQAGILGRVPGKNQFGGWKSNSLVEHSDEKSSKQENASGWAKDKAASQGGTSWNKSGGFDSGGKGNEVGSSWGNSSGGHGGQGSEWGSKKDENSDLGKEGKGWGKPVESSETSGWGQMKGTSGGNQSPDGGGSGHDAWTEAKKKSDLTKDSCVKTVMWGNKNSSDENTGWKRSGTASEPQAGGWGKTQGESASGGGKNDSWNNSSNGNWGKQENGSDWGKGKATNQGGSSWNKFGDSDSWDKANSTENDKGFGGHGFGGRRGRDGNRGGRSQFGSGRGGSFGQGSWSKENQDENDQGYGGRGFRGGRGRGGYNGGRDQGSSFGQGSWSKENQDENDQGYGGRGFRGGRGRGGYNGGRDQGRGSWSKENQDENDQGYGGCGLRGGRGRGGYNGGRDQGRGSSFGEGQYSNWSKENPASSSWGGSGRDQGSGWGNKKGWSSDPGTEEKQHNETSSWGSTKGISGGNQSSWGHASGGNGDQGSGWGIRKDWSSNSGTEGKSREPNETSSWGSAKGTSGGNQSSGSGGWLNKVDDNKNSSWGAPSVVKDVSSGNQAAGEGGWEKSSGGGSSSSWKSSGSGNQASGANVDQGKEGTARQAEPWNVEKKDAEKTNNWGKQSAGGWGGS